MQKSHIERSKQFEKSCKKEKRKSEYIQSKVYLFMVDRKYFKRLADCKKCLHSRIITSKKKTLQLHLTSRINCTDER